MSAVRRTASAAAFPELVAARSRARRREAITNLLMYVLLALFVGFVALMFNSLLALVRWFTGTIWHYLPKFLPSPDALALLIS